MALNFPNVYTHRKVADTAAKGCEICFKPSTSVLITPENKDFFYICPNHLKDRGFCTPIIDKAAEEAKRKQEEEDKEMRIKEEVDRVKKEYEKKQKKKKDRGEGEEKDDDADKDGKDTKDTTDGKDSNAGGKPGDNKDKTSYEKGEASQSSEPRVFQLQKFVYQQRLEKRRQAEMAKRNRERLANPSFFPSVPKGLP